MSQIYKKSTINGVTYLVHDFLLGGMKKKLDPRVHKIAKKIRQLRIDAGYTSYESFAFDKDLPRMQYWRMEAGTNFTIETLLKILDVHNVSLKSFFSDSDIVK